MTCFSCHSNDGFLYCIREEVTHVAQQRLSRCIVLWFTKEIRDAIGKIIQLICLVYDVINYDIIFCDEVFLHLKYADEKSHGAINH